MRMRKNVAVALSSLMLCAFTMCNAADVTPKTSIQGSKVFFLPTCIKTPAADYAYLAPPSENKELAPLIGALLSAVAPNIVDKLTSFVGNYFKKRAEEYSSTDTVATPVLFAGGDTSKFELGCMIYVAGEFGAGAEAGRGWTSQQMDSFGLAKAPKVYAEWLVHYADAAHKVVTLTPVHLEFESALSPRTGAGGKDLSFVIQLNDPLNLTKAGASSAGIPLPDATAGNAVPPKEKPSQNPKEKLSVKPSDIGPSGSTSTPSTGSTDASQSSVGQSVALFAFHFPKTQPNTQLTSRALKGMSAPAQSLRIAKNAVLNVQITEVETENGGDFMLQLSQFVSDNKSVADPILVDYLKKVLGPSSTTSGTATK